MAGPGQSIMEQLQALRDNPKALDQLSPREVLGIRSTKYDRRAVEDAYFARMDEARKYLASMYSNECVRYMNLLAQAFRAATDDLCQETAQREPPEQLRQYRLLEVLGKGSMGNSLQGRQHRVGQDRST